MIGCMIAASCVFAVILAVISLRWMFCAHFQRFLFALACFVTLIALFYAEEDWRGWHAWNQFKHEWEAKGEHFDFADFIPPPVPDEQNFALAPVGRSQRKAFWPQKLFQMVWKKLRRKWPH